MSGNDLDSLGSEINTYMQACAEVEKFSGAVLLVFQGRKLYCRAFGMACFEHMVPNAEKTKFRLGSITKPITAMAIQILVNEELLSLEDSVNKFFDDMPEHFNGITIAHLLNHSSGLVNFTDMSDYAARQRFPSTPAETIARFKYLAPVSPPGSQVRYNNSAYILLGAVIEKLSGKSYADFIEERIFRPLSMNDSGYDKFEPVLSNRAHGYVRQKDGLENAGFLDMSIPFAAGALYSSIADLYLFEKAIADRHPALPPQLFRLMDSGAEDGYAQGWRVENSDGRLKIGHSGGIDGFCTMMQRFPRQELSIIVLSNLVSWSYSPERICHDLSALVFGETYLIPKIRRTIRLDEERYDSYQGSYELESKLRLCISRDGGRWLARFSDDDPFEIFPESENEFYVRDFDAQIRVCLDDASRVSHLIIWHEGQSSRANKLCL